MGKIKIGLIILCSLALIGLVVAGIVMANSQPKANDKVSGGLEMGKPTIESLLPGKYIPDEIIVKFKGDREPFRVIKVPEGRVGEKIREYLARKDVEYAEPNYIAYALMVPNDPYYKYQWHLDNPVYGGIQMEKAWDISTGSPSVAVAIIDTGIAYENYGKYCQAPDLSQTCFVAGYDFVNNDNHPNDDNNHGTHVAGTVAQSTNNSTGVAGIAFKTCLMPVKVLSSGGSGTYANVAKGIRFAADNGAKVINLSLGGSASDNTLREAVKYASEKGATVIAACGNENSSNCLYPAAYDEFVIAVGATQYDEAKAPYSNYGSSLDLVAPGGNNSLDQNKDGYADGVLQQTFKSSWYVCNFAYYFFQGTSMAAPHVSGVAALLIAKGNATTPNEVRQALQETADDLGTPGRDNTYGWGLVNAYTALQWTAGPACSADADCNDGNECTSDVCINPGEANAYCQNIAMADNTVCTGGVCCSGTCLTPACTLDADCNDGNSCTVDTCNNGGTCAATCTHTNITTCVSGDGCCPAGCNSATDSDCPVANKCWSKDYQYLYRADDQSRKFCKCAQSTYGYNSYKYSWGTKTVYKYLDPANNENWGVTSLSSYTPVYSVTCTDGKAYLTNQDYFYPK